MILYLVALFLPIRWLPSIQPDIVYYFFKFLLVVFICTEGIDIVRREEYPVSRSWFVIFITLVLMGTIGLIRFTNLSIIINILFFISIVNFVYKGGEVTRILYFFTVWISILSIYSLIITYAPISGFSMNVPLGSEYRSPVERWPGTYIEINSFGFYGTRGIYTLTSMSFVFAVVYSVTYQSLKHWVMALIIGIQLINIFYLTGSGRSAFVLVLFCFVSLFVKKLSLTKLLPLITFFPLILWVLLYITFIYSSSLDILINLNTIMSNRLSLYFDSITVLISNEQSLVGWGSSPWENYSLSEVGVHNSIGTYGNTLTRSHNFLFEFIIQYGILIGLVFLVALISISIKVSNIIKYASDPTKLAASIVVLGVLFTGLSVGGKMGPFSVGTRGNIFWWIALGYLIGSSMKYYSSNQK